MKKWKLLEMGFLNHQNSEIQDAEAPGCRMSCELQEYSRTIVEYKHAGMYIPSIFLPCCWGSLFGVPSKVLL